jgi:HEAT repeat protein
MDQNPKDITTPSLQCGGQDCLSETEDIPETTEDRIIRLLYDLEDKSSSLRDDVAFLLRTLGRKEITILINVLKHEDPIIRKNAAYILGNLRDPKTVEPLIEALNDENADVRGEVVRTLGAIRDERATEPLIKMLNDECRDIRGWSASALTKIGFSAVDPLILALDEDNDNIRMNAT